MHKRSDKVAEAIHEMVSTLLVRGLKDPRIGFVTITGVKLTTDLHMATIYFSVVGSPEEKKATAAGLERARGFIRREIGGQLRMKYIPDIVFKYDESLDYGNKIDSILQQIHNQDSNHDS
jgi:ribosome-binding factor A